MVKVIMLSQLLAVRATFSFLKVKMHNVIYFYLKHYRENK